MTAPGGEMPFLDHLEELRVRLIRSIVALLAGCAVGFYVVQRFQLVAIMKRPIEPYLPAGGKLVVLSPTDSVMIVFKLSLVVGMVLAAPVLLWQAWAFLAPALYAREKRVIIPALFAGSGLFLLGAAVSWFFVLPQTLRVLFSFQTEALAPMITYQAYFDFLVQVVLALGISFELPLLILILAWLGVATPARLAGFRRYAIVLACIGGAILSPGTDLVSMVMFTIPLLVLYEIGYAGAVLLFRRRRKAAAAAVMILLLAGAGRLEAQNPPAKGRGRPPAAQDTTRAPVKAAPQRDSAAAALPAEPGALPAEGDSLLRALLNRPGYTVTRYQADSATLHAEQRRMELHGSAHTEREGMTLDAARIGYVEESCLLTAAGKPRLVDKAQTLVGDSIQYDTCRRRGFVRGGETQFQEAGAVWFLRGNVSQDSSSTRVFAGSSTLTTCNLPTPHYRFAAGKVKWVSKTMIVARPVVLYVADVPVLWLPFIFQDTRPGRRSGILIPQIGINDIVRTSSTYNRQITNIGYYWAPSEYVDLTGRLDWYSGRYVQFGVTGQYRFLDHFMDGSIGVNRQYESGGGRGFGFRWAHRQAFNISTSLNLDANYLSNSAVVDRNALDPLMNTQQVTSSVNFTKRFGWGSLALGGNRRQNLSDRSSTTQLPSLTISPKPLNIGRNVTWSPGLSLVNDDVRGINLGADLLIVRPDGGVDTVEQRGRTRATAFNLDTPIRFGAFNWRNSVNVVDRQETGRRSVAVRLPDLSTPNPDDSVTVFQITGGDFSTGINWETGINLPILFRNSWKLQPTVGVVNASTLGPFALRNRRTNGDFVMQGKRFQLSASMTPTFFGRFEHRIGPLAAIRHSISPLIRWDYSPSATVSEEYARALAGPGREPQLVSDARQTVSLGLAQAFEGKTMARPGDSLGTTARKIRLLSINTSPIVFDIEQAKKPGRTGWATQRVTNSVLSDLLPGFNLNVTHDLWRGVAGTDTAAFSLFLENVSANFSLSANTFRSIGSFFGLAGGNQREPGEPDDAGKPMSDPSSRFTPRAQSPGSFYGTDQIPLGVGGARHFTANVNYALTRTRPNPASPTQQPTRQSIGFGTMFSPTPYWAVSWQTQYNVTDTRFESHVVRLERDLHEWRAAFNFVRNANGNVAVYFSIFLTDLPELKLDFNQSTLGE